MSENHIPQPDKLSNYSRVIPDSFKSTRQAIDDAIHHGAVESVSNEHFRQLKPAAELTSIDCFRQVFKETQGENWSFNDRQEFQRHPQRWLKQHGYTLVKEPSEGDIVGYAGESAESTGAPIEQLSMEEFRPPYFGHVGILQEGKVISQFGRTGLFEHDLEYVPPLYGNNIYFIRKK